LFDDGDAENDDVTKDETSEEQKCNDEEGHQRTVGNTKEYVARH
jgi:hypothetical protein